MLKISQNWGKIANYPPNAEQKFAPVTQMMRSYYPPPTYTLEVIYYEDRLGEKSNSKRAPFVIGRSLETRTQTKH